MPHRPSRGAISRVALLAAYSRAGKRKQATADASLLSPSHTFSSPSPHPINNSLLVGPALRTDDSVRHASVLHAASARRMVPTSSGISKSKVIQLSNENVLTRLTDLQLRLIIIGLFLVRALIMEILLEPQHLGFEAKPLMTEEENFRILASIFVYVYRIIVHDSELRMTRKFGLKFRPV
ncbi:hypothetical protein T265_14760, partial [Opisthorchis viverrini]